MTEIEMGYLLMGCPRGKFAFERRSRPGQAFCSFLLRAGFDSYGIAADSEQGEKLRRCMRPAAIAAGLENDVFVMRSYDWSAECDCGFDQGLALVEKSFPHDQACYQSKLAEFKAELAERFGVKELWQAADRAGLEALRQKAGSAEYASLLNGIEKYNLAQGLLLFASAESRQIFEQARRKTACELERLEQDGTRALCQRFGFSFPYGSLVHCSCQRETRLQQYCQTNSHKQSCRLIQPNFVHKPSGFELSWYKRPLRSAMSNMRVSRRQFRRILDSCLESLQS